MRYYPVQQAGNSIVLIGMMGAGKSSVGRCLNRRTGLAILETDQIVASDFGTIDSRNFFQARRKEISQGRDGSTSDPLHNQTGNHRHRRRDGVAQTKRGNYEATRSDRVARRQRGNALCKSLANNRSAIAANEKPDRGVLGNLPCAQASVRDKLRIFASIRRSLQLKKSPRRF